MFRSDSLQTTRWNMEQHIPISIRLYKDGSLPQIDSSLLKYNDKYGDKERTEKHNKEREIICKKLQELLDKGNIGYDYIDNECHYIEVFSIASTPEQRDRRIELFYDSLPKVNNKD